jgi:hypothetical protein
MDLIDRSDLSDVFGPRVRRQRAFGYDTPVR